MTIQELKNYVAESTDNEFLQTIKITLDYPAINFNTILNGIIPIYEFILRQIDGYNQLGELPSELAAAKRPFVQVKDAIVSLVSSKNNNPHNWIDNLNILNRSKYAMFLYDSPETEFLLNTKKHFPNSYNGAFEYLTGNINQVNNKNFLLGYLMAYEFTSQENSILFKRKDAEKKSISKIRNDFEKYISESENHITDYLRNAKQKYDDYSLKIDTVKNEKEELFSSWYTKTTKEFNEFKNKSNEAVNELEKLYKEKLKLEAPAKYWNERSKKLRREGYWWLGGLIASIIASAWILIWVLNRIGNSTFLEIFKETGSAVKWSVALITLISFLAYAIRVLSKLTFSSFHLVRDAEEREQLTYVYLALQKEKGVDQTERHLIMQSLFSRADSGLLKDDASPTMPGNIVDQMTKGKQ